MDWYILMKNVYLSILGGQDLTVKTFELYCKETLSWSFKFVVVAKICDPPDLKVLPNTDVCCFDDGINELMTQKTHSARFEGQNTTVLYYHPVQDSSCMCWWMTEPDC